MHAKHRFVAPELEQEMKINKRKVSSTILSQ